MNRTGPLAAKQACRARSSSARLRSPPPLLRLRGRRKLEPAWWAPCGFAAIPTAALDPAHSPASPAVPALDLGPGPHWIDRAGYSASAGTTDSISVMV